MTILGTEWADYAALLSQQQTLPEDVIIAAAKCALRLDDAEALCMVAPWVALVDDIQIKITCCDQLRQKGTALQQRGDFAGALILWQGIIHIAPNQPEIWTDIALCFRHQERWADERNALEKALAQRPDDVWLWIFYGYVLERFDDYEGAYAAHRKAFDIRPALAESISALDWSARRIAAWDDVDQIAPVLCDTTRQTACSECTLHLIYRYDDDTIINSRLKEWADFYAKGHQGPDLVPRATAQQPDKILRIGYLSGDFHNHPVSHLLGGLFSGHNRARISPIALSIGADDNSFYRHKIMQDADEFHDLQGLGAARLAERIAELNIDILVDLKGMTMPIGVLAFRPAPVIASWLGFPGSTGAKYVDYLIADQYVVPETARPFYPEAIAYMPISYLLTDDQQAKKPALDPATAFPGAPANSVFFGGWCHVGKIQRDLFMAWMEILRAAPNVILVLRRPIPSVHQRLISAAEQAGIDPARLYFGSVTGDKQDHFARLGTLDLFLDSWIYGSHSTGCDALWAGVPMLTRRGNHFASRVGESLLHGTGLSELIANDTQEYIDRAVALARDPDARARLKAHLAQPEHLPLFQTRPRIAELEQLYRQMWANACASDAPQDIFLTP